MAAMDKPDTLARLGRVFYGLSLIAFGIQQFLWGDFVPGRAPAWPATMPGRLVWAYASAIVLIAAGVAIVVEKKARLAAVTVAVMIFAWAALRNVPVAAADHNYGGAWTYVGRVLLGAFLVSSGIQHFLFPQFVMTLVPAWIPGALFWTYFAGVALIAGGLGLLVNRTARLAAALSGLMIFLWLVMLHIPRALAAPEALSRNEWTSVMEAFAMSGIAFALVRGALRGPRDAEAAGRL